MHTDWKLFSYMLNTRNDANTLHKDYRIFDKNNKRRRHADDVTRAFFILSTSIADMSVADEFTFSAHALTTILRCWTSKSVHTSAL